MCRGDSGGALYVQHEPGIDTIEAVVSGGVGLCGKGYPRWWIKIASYRDQLYKIGLPGKYILGDYFQENRTSREPFLLLRISFPGRPIFIQLPPAQQARHPQRRRRQARGHVEDARKHSQVSQEER